VSLAHELEGRNIVAGLWGSLLPLAIASAVVPIQLVITVLLLRSGHGRVASLAWVAGMLTVRLGQGIVFGLILGPDVLGGGASGPDTAVSLLLLVVAILFLVMAARKLVDDPDEDAPPPRWMVGVERATPARAYLMGVGMLLIGAKFWVFTLGAISTIDAADLGQGGALLAYLVFVLLAMSVHLGIVGIAYAAPARADVALTRFSGLLTRYDRPVTIALGGVFGAWFLVKALDGLGVI
jgi:hypothetical protein